MDPGVVSTQPSTGDVVAPDVEAATIGLRRSPRRAPSAAAPPRKASRAGQVSSRTALISSAMTVVSALLLGFAAVVILLGALHHGRDQDVAFAQLRLELATGTAPLGALGSDGKPVPAGAPVALLEAPEIGLREVVVQGTSAGQLRSGPGHRADTVLPGQAGTSVVMGRRAAYGGPFSRLAELKPGSRITVTTGQGKFAFTVLGSRVAGDLLPAPPGQGRGRMTLVTSSGPAYLPEGVLAVDADLDSAAVAAPGPGRAVSESDLPMAIDTDALFPLVLWLQALLLASLASAWARQRWGRWQSWLIGVPVLVWIGASAADQAACLLPNLL